MSAERQTRQFMVAVLLPLLVAAAAWTLHGRISAANISLLFIVAVIVIAVNTGTRPAMVAAVASFLAFNFSFTEPRGTLLMVERQDMLTAVLFLVAAIIVGQLAARLREQLASLQVREQISRTELGFLEKLGTAVGPGEILDAFNEAVSNIPELRFTLVECSDGVPVWAGLDPLLVDPLRTEIAALQGGHADFLNNSEFTLDDQQVLLLHDSHQLDAVFIAQASTAAIRDTSRLLAQQTNLALIRTHLAAEVDRERLAREQELMRSSLLSSVSHDFRTPLTAMTGAASTLLELDAQLAPEQKKELLQSILSEASRLNIYTQKLLDMTRLGKGKLNLNRSTLGIDEILNVVLKRIHQQFPQQVIKLQLPPGLPLLQVHAALIEQALYNVIENACKFSSPGQPIQLSCHTREQQMVIDVEDSGPGIPDSEKLHVFEMFHSAERGDRRAAGTGLGLAICKGMIGAHGGSVEIQDSQQLGGCLVRLVLPVSTTD